MIDNPCTCTEPGYCTHRGRPVTAMGLAICRGGDPQSVEAYFREPGSKLVAQRLRLPPTRRTSSCQWLGEPIKGADGQAKTLNCPTCSGTVRLKVFGCEHPDHVTDPTTTSKACERCRDYQPRTEEVAPVSDNAELNYWRGG